MYKKWIGIGLICAVLAMAIEVYMVGVLWTEKDTYQVFVLKKDLKTGVVVGDEDLMKIEVDKNQVIKDSIKEGSKYLKRKLTRDVAAGKVLTALDFEENPSGQKVESIVVKLDYEQGHGGKLGEGELINMLCYRQGGVTLVKDLVVSGIEKDLVNMGDGAYYMTISGKSESLETLVLAKKEGSIHILKKTAVHN